MWAPRNSVEGTQPMPETGIVPLRKFLNVASFSMLMQACISQAMSPPAQDFARARRTKV
jgi:hypothetical protein